MSFKTIISTVVLLTGLIIGSSSATARQAYYDALTAQYGTNTGCYVCHDSTVSKLSPFGQVFLNAAGDTATRVASAGNTTNPVTTNTYGEDITTGGILPEGSSISGTGTTTAGTTDGDDSDGEGDDGAPAPVGCMTDNMPLSGLILMALLSLGVLPKRKKS